MKTLLIVDDEKFMPHIFTYHLCGARLTVIAAHNGQEALAIIKDHQIELVVSDCQMPILNGFQMARQLRKDPATSLTPILMLTAQDHKLPVNDIVQKSDHATACRRVMASPFQNGRDLNRQQ